MVDDTDTENETDVDLKGVIKDLQDEIKALNKLLQSFGKNIGQGNAAFHKTYAQQKELIRLQGQMVRDNADYRKSLQNGTSALDQFGQALSGSFSPMQMFLGVVGKMGGLSKELDDFKKKSAEFDTMKKDMGVAGLDPTSKAFAKKLSTEDKQKYMDKSAEVDEAETKKKGAFGGQGGVSGKLVEGMSKMSEFAKKHATGIIIGAGSVGILLLAIKKALDASPMFQQMMKLLNFGIMMVLRPIGDFFGFLFRPILIMLLRKFIIPWYTKMYPAMIKMGDLIGNKLSGAFEALAKGDVATAFAILFAGVDFKKILGDAFAGLKTWIAETDWDAVWNDITAGLVAFGTGIWDLIIVPIGEAIWKELEKIDWYAAIWDTLKTILPVLAVGDLLAGIFGIGNNKWFNEWGREIRAWFLGGLEEAVTEWDKMWTDYYDWLFTGINNVTQNWQDIWDRFMDWLNPFTSSVDTSNNNNNNNNQVDEEPWWAWAKGGHITEPMAAVGLRSGRKVMMGEAGNETVIPDDQLGGGGNITINIENMSASQQDLNNLRQVILDVIQQSSSRRGRA